MTSFHELKQLSLKSRNRIQAGMKIQNYYNIVEELVMNSIDANSLNIEIFCNINEFTIEIRDDGIGFDKSSLFKLGWNMTTKHNSISSSQGKEWKGEILAAISEISDLVIISKTIREKSSYGVKFNSGSCEPLNINNHEFHKRQGTTVTVSNVFKSLPVRRKSVNYNIEMDNIKDFIERINLLHYKISIHVTEIINNNDIFRIPKRKIVYQSSSHDSVGSKFMYIHSKEALSKMEVSLIY